jgi:hypothetical protein
VTHPLALECGFDAGFGVGTKPSDVASYVVEEFLRRRERFDGIPNPLAPPAEERTEKSPKKAPKSKKRPIKSKLEVKFRKKPSQTKKPKK